MSMNISNSAIKKGETLIDTAMTLNAMHPDIIVIRHQDSGACNLLSQKVNCAVLNAGDGRREHPTQALLDALTIITRKKKIEGLRVAICGDIVHSRVARSNIYLLNMLGAEVNIIAPTNLMPKEIEKFGVNTFTDMKKGLKDCDIVMMLRLQNERMTSSYLASNREYYEYYGLTQDKLDHAKPDAIIMHPGPMNRGIEIDTVLADDINKSVIKEQVELGVAVRMACLKIFCK
jgi:aspartate carbamoyltransferase catalytic subunit